MLALWPLITLKRAFSLIAPAPFLFFIFLMLYLLGVALGSSTLFTDPNFWTISYLQQHPDTDD